MDRVKLHALRITCALVAMCIFPVVGTMAQEQNAPAGAPAVQVQISVVQEVTDVDPNGNLVVEAKAVGLVSPGDVLIYTLRAENNGDSPAFDARIEDPIPAGTFLLPESVTEADSTISASIDGGESWRSFPVFIEAGSDENGQTIYEQASAESYTHLRWLLDGPLPPGAAKEVSFKVQVR